MTHLLLRLLERRLARRVPAGRLAPMLGDLLEDYTQQAARRGWLAAQIWLARESLSLIAAYRAGASPRATPLPGSTSSHASPHADLRADATARTRRRFAWLDELRQDIRYARRSFARHPGFTAVAIVTLTLGIGANTAIFSVVHAVLLRPLPYTDSDRLVELIGRRPVPGDPRGTQVGPAMDLGTLAAFRTHTRTLSHIGVHDRTTTTLALGDGSEPVPVVGHKVSASFLPMLGARPLLGRLFAPGEEQPGADAVIVLGYTAWQRYVGGDPQVLGRAITLGERRYTVIGVMDRRFQFPDALTQFWVPFVLPAGGPETRTSMTITARLADGATTDAAAAELATILRSLPQPAAGPPAGMPSPPPAATRGGTPAAPAPPSRPPSAPGPARSPDARATRRPPAGPVGFLVVRVQDQLVAPVKPALLVLAAAVGIVLLIACVNVANLLLATTAVRQREMAVRLALGAARGRLIRQTLTESVLLALAGGVAGTALAIGGVPLLRSLGATLPRPDLQAGVQIPRLDEIGVDVTVLAFTAAVSVLTGVLFGIAPALRHLRVPLLDALRAGGAPIAGFNLLRRQRLQGLLVIAQIALAMMLFIGGGLLIHSFVKLSRVDPGYDVSNILTFKASLDAGRDATVRLATFEAFVERLRAMPGVEEAGYTGTLPMVQARGFVPLRTTPQSPAPPPPGAGPPQDRANPRYVSRHYLQAMGVRVLAGRGFGDSDRDGQPRVMLVNETAVRMGLLGPNPLGAQTYAIGRQPWEVVGIVEDVRQFGLDRAPIPEFFIDLRQLPGYPFAEAGPYFIVRTTGAPASMVSAIRGLVRELDPHATLDSVAPMDAIVSNSVARPRLYAVLVGLFAIVAVALAAVGIYGVMAYFVAQRTREVGIRMALGARGPAVMGLVLRQSVVLIAIGVALGLGGAMAAARSLEGLLFGLTPFDATTFVTASVLFAGIAALASYVPARRATRIEPLVALRGE